MWFSYIFKSIRVVAFSCCFGNILPVYENRIYNLSIVSGNIILLVVAIVYFRKARVCNRSTCGSSGIDCRIEICINLICDFISYGFACGSQAVNRDSLSAIICTVPIRTVI